ncbi:unnamed protein product [Amoebophrya sp. A120]|nr:unnamed protein product [Amoebophrya sp. A120]|eukprot:GSA120T00013436001.1
MHMRRSEEALTLSDDHFVTQALRRLELTQQYYSNFYTAQSGAGTQLELRVEQADCLKGSQQLEPTPTSLLQGRFVETTELSSLWTRNWLACEQYLVDCASGKLAG